MKYKYQGYEYVLDLTKKMLEIGDTKLGHIILDEFWERINKLNPPPITQRIIENKLLEATAFLVVVQCPKLAIECIKHYDSQSCEFKTCDNRLFIKIQRDNFASYLKIPQRELFLNLKFSSSQFEFSTNKGYY